MFECTTGEQQPVTCQSGPVTLQTCINCNIRGLWGGDGGWGECAVTSHPNATLATCADRLNGTDIVMAEMRLENDFACILSKCSYGDLNWDWSRAMIRRTCNPGNDGNIKC